MPLIYQIFLCVLKRVDMRKYAWNYKTINMEYPKFLCNIWRLNISTIFTYDVVTVILIETTPQALEMYVYIAHSEVSHHSPLWYGNGIYNDDMINTMYADALGHCINKSHDGGGRLVWFGRFLFPSSAENYFKCDRHNVCKSLIKMVLTSCRQKL